METKHILALLVFVAVGCGSVLAASVSQRLRDGVFAAMLACAIFAEQCDVNFFGEYWYRGTARGFGVSVTDILALALIVAGWVNPRHAPRRGFLPMGLLALLVYLGYGVFSTVTAANPRFAGWELANVVRAVLVFVAGALYLRSRREFAVLVVSLSALMLVQLGYGFHQRLDGGLYRVRGTFEHANSLSMYACTVAPVLLAAALSRWDPRLRLGAGAGVAAATLCVLLSVSRAGQPIFLAVMLGTALACVEWRFARRTVLVVSAVALAYAAALAGTWDRIQARYAQTTLVEEYLDEQRDGRGLYLRLALALVREHPLGVGLNNWSYVVSKHFGPESGMTYEDYDAIEADPEKGNLPSTRYAAPAHSLAALTLGELGWPGFVIFTVVWIQWFRMGARFLRDRLNAAPLHRLGVGLLFATAGLFLQSLTEWTYRQSTIFHTVHLLLGGLASLEWLRRADAAREPLLGVGLPLPTGEPQPVPLLTSAK